MKKNKNLILEIIILLTILGSVGVIYYIYKELNNISPKYSNSNEITNYSKNRYFKIDKPFENISTYKVPETDYLDYDTSTYDYYITSTDNYINTITEKIILYYLEDENLNLNTLTNYCNAYDEITSDYTMTCSIKNRKLEINNVFYLENIFTDDITTKKFTIKKDVKYNDLLSTYLETLTSNNITYEEIDNIE